MSLERLNIEKMRASFAYIWKSEQRILDEQREIARELKKDVRRLGHYQGSTVAFVAADGGDNRIHLNASMSAGPAVVELVRIVDSNGREQALEAFCGTEGDNVFDKNSPAHRLCRELGQEKVADLSPFLGNKNLSRSVQMSEYREIVEWAVLHDLLTGKAWGSDTLLVREGALRTRAFTPSSFEALDKKIRGAHEQHKRDGINMYFAGVAKQTALLNRLHSALLLENVFDREEPQFVHVPRDIAEKFYKRRWLDTMETAANREYSSLAEMYLVKFGDHPLDRVWPVDIAVWQSNDAEKILGYLAEDARPGFPIPDFPSCIQRAHEHAKVGGIELSYLTDLLFEQISGDMNEEDREKIMRAYCLREDVTALRYHHE